MQGRKVTQRLYRYKQTITLDLSIKYIYYSSTYKKFPKNLKPLRKKTIRQFPYFLDLFFNMEVESNKVYCMHKRRQCIQKAKCLR